MRIAWLQPKYGATFAVLTALIACCAPTGRACGQERQPPTADSPPGDYEALIKKAIVEFDLGHWSEAKAFFSRAHAVRPSARTLRSLGLVSYELRLYVEALQHLRAALDSTVLPLTQEMRERTTQQIADAESFITYQHIVLEPKHANLRVDGAPAVFAADGSVMLNPGLHDIAADAPGHRPITRSVQATGGRSELQLRLEPELSPALAAASVTPSTDTQLAHTTNEPGFWGSRSTMQWVGIGLGAAAVVAVGVGTIYSVLALNEKSAWREACGGRACDDPAGLAHHRAALTRADVATVSFVTGAALLAGGLGLYLGGGRSTEQPSAAVQWTPVLGYGVAAVSLRTQL